MKLYVSALIKQGTGEIIGVAVSEQHLTHEHITVHRRVQRGTYVRHDFECEAPSFMKARAMIQALVVDRGQNRMAAAPEAPFVITTQRGGVEVGRE